MWSEGQWEASKTMGDYFAPLGPPLLPWHPMAQIYIHTDMATPRLTRASGAELVKRNYKWCSCKKEKKKHQHNWCHLCPEGWTVLLLRRVWTFAMDWSSPTCSWATDVWPVLNPFSQFVPQLELYSQLQLSLWSEPIANRVPKSTQWVLVKIQVVGNQSETQMKKWWKFEQFLSSRTKWKVTLKGFNAYFR